VQTSCKPTNAAAIAAVPDLIAEVRELRAVRDEIERLRAALKTMRASHQRHMSNRELASIATVLGEEWNK
jgi:HAMP domain-containing protein